MQARGEAKNGPDVNGEYWLLRNVVTSCRPPLMLFDVGANRGNWTAMALACAAGSQLRVYAFEPSGATRQALTSRFVTQSEITIESYALADEIREGTFFSSEPCAGTNSL